MLKFVGTILLLVVAAYLLVGGYLFVPRPDRPDVLNLLIFLILAVISLAGVYGSIAGTNRADAAERALATDRLTQEGFLHFTEMLHGARRSLFVLTLLSGIIAAGFCMSFLVPEQEIASLGAIVGNQSLDLTTRNTGLVVMVCAIFVLCLVAAGSGAVAAFKRHEPRLQTAAPTIPPVRQVRG